jgi:murein DD-endopeptidase MepM/ murein hydrolase activator NlpD
MQDVTSRRGATRLTPEPAPPKRYLILAGALLLPLLIVWALPEDPVSMPIIVLSEAPETVAPIREATPRVTHVEAPLAAPTEEPGVDPREDWRDTEVRNGDNLSLIFQRMGLNDADVHSVVSSSAEAKKLAQLHPGDTMSFLFTETGELDTLKYVKSPVESVFYSRTEGSDDFSVKTVMREPEIRRSYAGAEIESSLFLAGQDAGLSHSTIMELANIFGGVIDFILDPRRGDTINLLYEDLYLDEAKFRDGSILAVEFINQGKSHIAYRYVDESNKVGYYNPNGVSMRKAFLRAPLDFTRVSSNFNLKRLHPVLKYTRPHRGTDYAAPRGTPVFAAGDGRVIEAGYTSANGNYLVIQHGQQYTTKYLHLNKRAVKRNSRVKQQQVIGWVGSTGLASGPHLHYEFLVNGVHRNPRTILQKLPKAQTLSDVEMQRFHDQTAALGNQLSSFSQQRVASHASGATSTAL